MLDVEKRLRICRTGTFSHLREAEGRDEGFVGNLEWKGTDILVSTPQNLMNYLNVFGKGKDKELKPGFVVLD